MKFEWIKEEYLSFQNKHSDTNRSRATILFWMQLTLIALFLFILVVMLIDRNENFQFYIMLVFGLLCAVIFALLLNLNGRYRSTALLTTVCFLVGPWFSILFDNAIMNGDFVPLVYITISIQLCSILLSVLATIGITIIQIAFLITFILSNENLTSINWPSLLFFVFFTSTLGIVTSYITRNQIKKIEKQKNLLQETEINLIELSVRDSLTGLFNRRYMKETLDREINAAIRKNRNLTIIMIDINAFKQINDNFGHGMGDYVLREVSQVLKDFIRNSDVACRYGGDEFILILIECTLEDATNRIKLIQELLKERAYSYDGKILTNVTFSFGVAALSDHCLTSIDLLKIADEALYIQKQELYK